MMSEETNPTPESTEPTPAENVETTSAETTETPAETVTTDTSAETVTEETSETPATEEKRVRKEAVPAEPDTPHDDFDWSISNRNQVAYTQAEFDRLEALYEKTLGAVNENEVIKARLTQVTGGDAVLDINFKSDGLVAMSEFRDIEGLKVGDEVDVYVERQEDERGQLVLSRRKAKLLKAWDRLVDS